MIPQEGLVLGTRPQVFLHAGPKTTVGSWELTSSGQVANIQVLCLTHSYSLNPFNIPLT